jgi:hypothetical protein
MLVTVDETGHVPSQAVKMLQLCFNFCLHCITVQCPAENRNAKAVLAQKTPWAAPSNSRKSHQRRNCSWNYRQYET